MKDLVNSKKLKNFKFVPQVPYNIIPNYVMATDLQCILSSPKLDVCYLSNPNKFFESISLGIPLLNSNFGTLKQLITDVKCGLTVDSEDPNDIAEKIIYLSENPDLRKEMGKSGMEASKKIYNWKFQSEKFLEKYEEL